MDVLRKLVDGETALRRWLWFSLICNMGIIVTGAIGAVASPFLIKIFRITDPLAAGLGIGAASHAMGASKAMEIGKTEGAMSGLAIGMCGIITAILALFFDFLA